ncbi:MAG: bifunctional 4-hydroxy-2-oxoglutarate aldolase/2-dehydro-3-deoxy-phosphogluconate aldolase [Pseudomonadota bacterium]
MMDISQIMQTAPVIPVLIIEDIAHAKPIAQALVEGGLPVLEVTLRTPCALDAIAAMREVEGAIVGAGTVLNPAHLGEAMAAGAEFIVSPGLTEGLGRAALDAGVPFLPGVANAGDIMRGMELGLSHFKFFPAEASGGIKALKAIIGPFGDARFCPTGGVTQESAADWLALDAVLCVGGSWIVPKGPLETDTITRNAKAASALGGYPQ